LARSSVINCQLVVMERGTVTGEPLKDTWMPFVAVEERTANWRDV